MIINSSVFRFHFIWQNMKGLKIMLIFAFTCLHIASAKVNNGGKSSGLTWPNFFNPKQSIMRENGDKGTRIMEKKDQRTFPPQDKSNDEQKELSSGEENVENLIDYTIKGGLRGTYILLNSSSNFDHLSEEAQTALTNILRRDGELFREVDEDLLEGEITEEGVRLRTPILLKTHSKTLGKYGVRVTFYTGDEFTSFVYFGNWCGRGGRSAPVDNIDGCCLEHEKCYGKHVRQCPDIWKKPYHLMYAWLVMNTDPVCVRSDSSCVNDVCQCDREASLCFRYFLQNPQEIPLHVEPPHRVSKKARK